MRLERPKTCFRQLLGHAAIRVYRRGKSARTDGRNFGEVMIADGYAHEYTYDQPNA
jgi:endonuclease YncB( thermonuclease family)